MKDLFLKNNIDIKDDLIEKFNLFYNIVISENEKYNLTSILGKEEFFYKHILDSIYPCFLFKENSKICDIGAGAGFPSIPLSLFLPTSSFVLLDSINKKIKFLELCKKELNLKNIFPVHTRIEDHALKNRNTYDYVIGRGVAPLNIFLEYSIPLIKPKGSVLAYKGKNFSEEYVLSKNAIEKLNCIFIKNISYKYSIANEVYKRNIMLFTKNQSSNDFYPRKNNKPRTDPL